MAKEVNKFILEGEEIEFTDSKAREDISDLDNKIDDEVGRLEIEISGKATIDDSDITTSKTWSSSQIFAEDNSIREITATLNLTNRAEQAYNVGDLITYNEKLYKVIASISQGDLLTPGTNIQLSKVSTELKNLDTTCGNLQSQINNKASIDDSDITTNKTWSSSKILAEDNSIREDIAILNITNRAEQAYNAGDLIECSFGLVKASASISQGDLLELGVNISSTTVAAEIQSVVGTDSDNYVSLTLGDVTTQFNLRRRGNTCYLIGEFASYTLQSYTSAIQLGTLPNDFRPKQLTQFTCIAHDANIIENSNFLTVYRLDLYPDDGRILMRGIPSQLIQTVNTSIIIEWEV